MFSVWQPVSRKRFLSWKVNESVVLISNLVVQFSLVCQPCPTLCDPMDCSTPGLPVYHQLPKFAQTHVHRVSDAIQPSHPLSSPSPPAFSLSQHQGLFQGVSSSRQLAKVLEHTRLSCTPLSPGVCSNSRPLSW